MRGSLVVLMLCACAGQTAPASRPRPAAKKSTVSPAVDSDSDGLCDITEQQLGTDPMSADTDSDGLPDAIEVSYGFDPTDQTAPSADQLAHLEARGGAVLDFPVRTTVQGDGQGVTGVFQPLSSIYADGATAEDFFIGASAVSADPADGVRSIATGSARFDSVLGPTRLAFSLHFEHPTDDTKAPSCAKAYPFRYSVKSDDGDTRGDRLFLLIVSPEGQAGTAPQYCPLKGCQ
jgi:hypothetical protein